MTTEGDIVTVENAPIEGEWTVVKHPYDLIIPGPPSKRSEYEAFFEDLLEEYSVDSFEQYGTVRGAERGVAFNPPDTLIRRENRLCYVPMSICTYE